MKWGTGAAALFAFLAARALAPDPFRKADGMNKAPELEGGTAWLNTEKPLRLTDLKGKIILLDFWTFG